MADKKKKGKKKSGGSKRADSVRSAVEQTFESTTEGARTRVADLVDEISTAAQRVRTTLEDLNVADELRNLRSQVEHLAERVNELEVGGRSLGGRKPASGAT